LSASQPRQGLWFFGLRACQGRHRQRSPQGRMRLNTRTRGAEDEAPACSLILRWVVCVTSVNAAASLRVYPSASCHPCLCVSFPSCAAWLSSHASVQRVHLWR